MERKFVTKQRQVQCPECGNGTEFVACSEQVAEDCCDVWIKCGVCGYDPTAKDTGDRIEDVWGDISDGAIPGIFQYTWRDMVSA